MTQKQTVLRMLEEAGPEGVTSNQFYAACLPRFGARIFELKKDGLNVIKEPAEQGHFRYILVSHGRPEREADHPGLGRPVQSGAHLHREPVTAHDGTSRCGSSPAMSPVEAAPSSEAPAPGQLFEVIEDGPTGPVNPYEWEAA